jgi:uncharacterized protein (DUF1697 family)
MPTHLALLRAVNVSGRNKVPMAELRAAMTGAGFGNVRTYIQSGNVLFDHPSSDEATLRSELAALIETQFAVKSPVVLRSRDELADAIANCPFVPEPGAEKHLHILFLGDTPSEEQVAALDPNRSPQDRFVVRGRDMYVQYTSVPDSKLTNVYVDRVLGTVSTARNWRTVNTLLGMLDGA